MVRKKAKEKKLTAADIVKMVNDRRTSSEWKALLDQMERHFDLFAKKPYVAEKGHEAYTSPAPRNDFNKVVDRINRAELIYQIQLPEDATQNERDAANKGEQFLAAVMGGIDKERRSGGEGTLREALTWFGGCRGISGLRYLNYTNEDGENVSDGDALDPMHLVWEKGKDRKLLWAAYTYYISPTEANDRWNLDIEGVEPVEFIDYYGRKVNAQVLVESQKGEGGNRFVKEPEPHGLDHVPIFVGFVGNMPTVYDRNGKQRLAEQAQSVYASSEKVYAPRNKQISLAMDVAEKNYTGTLVFSSRTGDASHIKGDPHGAWQIFTLSTEKEEEITNLPQVPLPVASELVLAQLDRDKQESTLPWPIAQGLDPQAHSGAALAMLNDNMKSIYNPFAELIAKAFTWLCEEILVQFKTKGKAMKLQGVNKEGKFFRVPEFTPDDIQDDWVVGVTCEPQLPRDEMQDAQMALALTAPKPPDNRPTLSWQTVMEKVLRIRNPDAENERINAEMLQRRIEAMPDIQMRKLALDAFEKGDFDLARQFLKMMPNPVMGIDVMAKLLTAQGFQVVPPGTTGTGTMAEAAGPEVAAAPVAAGPMAGQAAPAQQPQIDPRILAMIAAAQAQQQGGAQI